MARQAIAKMAICRERACPSAGAATPHSDDLYCQDRHPPKLDRNISALPQAGAALQLQAWDKTAAISPRSAFVSTMSFACRRSFSVKTASRTEPASNKL